MKKTICSFVVIVFMNPFNAFTELLKWRDYINNADLLQQQLTFELANE